MALIKDYFKKRVILLMVPQVLLIFLWLLDLNKFDLVSVTGVLYHKYDLVNVLCAGIGFFCMWDNLKEGIKLSGRTLAAFSICAFVFSLATLMACYPAFEPFGNPRNLLNFCAGLPGGFIVCFHTLVCAVRRLPLIRLTEAKRQNRVHSVRVYLLSFAFIAAVYLLYFFCVAYPGYYSTDSYVAIKQALSGVYDNTTPFWHTMVIKLCMGIGAMLGGQGGSMMCVYGVVQCIFMAAAFAYVIVTLYQAGVPKWIIGFVLAMYTFLTYNLAYSATMWKDIPFSIAALLMVTAMYRILRGIGRSELGSYIVFALGGLLFSLMRTNGMYSCMAAAVLMAAPLWKQRRKLLLVLCAFLAAAWICNGPVLDALHVSETNYVEALAIPFQQISRVIVDDCEIAEEDMDMIEEIFWVDRIREVYDPLSVDNVKFNAFQLDKADYLKEHKAEYLSLWLRLGRQYPWEYTKAWIDETQGFWNAGYHYWIYHNGGDNEELGIVRPVIDNPVADGFSWLFTFLQDTAIITQIFYSIGFHVWILIFCWIVNRQKKQIEYLLTIPILVIVIGLWIGTPVFAEFRYAYPVFVTVPLLLPVTLFRVEK